MIADTLGRRVAYLRLSLTQSCPMRCVYCRPSFHKNDDGQRETLLTRQEIRLVVSHLVARHGVRKVRLTGGEPTSRSDVIGIISDLAAIRGLSTLVMTTNGLTLGHLARPLRSAGLQRVNVSLDSLNAEGFRRITGYDGIQQVLKGIEEAQRVGLGPVKVNTVVVRGENDHELPGLLLYAADHQLEIRFIELMPMGPLADAWSRRYVPASEMRWRLRTAVRAWNAGKRGSDAATPMRAQLRDGRWVDVGFITAMSCPFCDSCDRLRIDSTGLFYPCLMDQPAGTLLDAIRPEFDPQKFDRRLDEGYIRKAAEHPARGATSMVSIGG